MGLVPFSAVLLMELQRNTHHVYRLMYHFVWTPKYRHKVFSEPCRGTLKAIIEKIGFDYDIDVTELEVPEDHIHMVVRSEPKMSPSKVMQIVKSISAREFLRHYPEIKKRYFLGGKLWTLYYKLNRCSEAIPCYEEVIQMYESQNKEPSKTILNQLAKSREKVAKAKKSN